MNNLKEIFLIRNKEGKFLAFASKDLAQRFHNAICEAYMQNDIEVPNVDGIITVLLSTDEDVHNYFEACQMKVIHSLPATGEA